VNPLGTVIAGTPTTVKQLVGSSHSMSLVMGLPATSLGKGSSTGKGGIAVVEAMMRSHRAENSRTRCESAVRSRSRRPRHRRGRGGSSRTAAPARVGASAGVIRSRAELKPIVSA
jgi:hypothetical protein